MIKNVFKMFLIASLFFVGGCETFDLDQTDNPSVLPPELLDPVYVFNYAQLTLPDFVNSSNGFAQRVTRQFAMTGGNTYNNAFAPENFDNNWTTGYLILNAIKTMEPQAIANRQNFILGASKVMRCYILMTMVDMYGSIPYSEALQGNDNQTPKYDTSESVYQGVYQELDQAIGYLTNIADIPPTLRGRDLYYGSGTENTPNADNWIRLAKTLKFKMLVNARAVGHIGTIDVDSEMGVLLTGDQLITESQYDFAFQYGSERDDPNSRHPQYNDHYELGSGAYIANYFFWTVASEKGGSLKDPREAFYFFRQAGIDASGTNSTNLPCRFLAKPNHFDDPQYNSFYDATIHSPYCVSSYTGNSLTFSFGSVVGTTYLGRDHGDNSGIPQDDELRSVVGLYPAGGAIGSPRNVNNLTNFGLRGALGRGIMPMMLSSWVHFMISESLQAKGSGIGTVPFSDVKVEFDKAVDQSITKVVGFIPDYTEGRPSETTTSDMKDLYETFVSNTFNASSGARRLELIDKEFYIATWGNGIEPYNTYRRTGYPSNFQPTIEENPGPFFSTALYPAASVDNNPNAPANVRTKKTFWDVLGLELH